MTKLTVNPYHPSAPTPGNLLDSGMRKISMERRLRRFFYLATNPDVMLKTTMVAVVLAVAVLGIAYNGRLFAWFEALRDRYLAFRILLIAAQALAIVAAAAFVWRVVLFWKYRPAAACPDALLPVCTVIVPAYNEGRGVLETLRSVVANDYPAAKLQVIGVDDGSKDDTWEWLKIAARELKGRVEVYRLPVNRGKRHALYAGFMRARGEVVVTVDSDSVLETATLRRLVSPFVHDRRIGGVAGNVRVHNLSDGLIPRMLDVSFLYSFDFMRSTQSMVNTVMCTPGALAAYRTDVVLKVLDEWMKQTFCGRPANIGEDRAITNLILREGYHVTFQQDAVVYTKVPAGYRGLCRMFIRWARSNVRETIAMCRFTFKRFRTTPVLGARINLLLSILPMTVGPVMLLATVGLLLSMPVMFGAKLLLGSAIAAAAPAALFAWRRRSSDALLAVAYSWFWLFALSWINVYSLVTAHRNGWLTRQLAPEPAAPQTAPQRPLVAGPMLEKVAV